MSRRHEVQDATGVISSAPGVGILHAFGDEVPADGAVGYATGCLFAHIDGGDGTALYVNEGDATDADFNAITVA